MPCQRSMRGITAPPGAAAGRPCRRRPRARCRSWTRKRSGQVDDRGGDLVARTPVGRSAAGPRARRARRPGRRRRRAAGRPRGCRRCRGCTQLTRMPSRTWSAAIARVSASTAPLLAEYRARCGRPAVAAIEQVLTIAACSDARRCGRAARVTRTMPTTLTSSTRCHCSSGLSSTVPAAPIPALLTRMSRYRRAPRRRPRRPRAPRRRRRRRREAQSAVPGTPPGPGRARRPPRRGRRAAARWPGRCPEAPPVTIGAQAGRALPLMPSPPSRPGQVCGSRTCRPDTCIPDGAMRASGRRSRARSARRSARRAMRTGSRKCSCRWSTYSMTRSASGAGQGHVVEHGQVLDQLAQPDAAGVRADRARRTWPPAAGSRGSR